MEWSEIPLSDFSGTVFCQQCGSELCEDQQPLIAEDSTVVCSADCAHEIESLAVIGRKNIAVLEYFIDTYGVTATLGAVSGVMRSRAENIRGSWPEALVRDWDRGISDLRQAIRMMSRRKGLSTYVPGDDDEQG